MSREAGFTEDRTVNSTLFGETSKKRKGGLKGGVQSVASKINELINGEPVDLLPASVRKAADKATVDDFRTGLHNTKTTEGRRWLRWARKTEQEQPEFKRVYPEFESWWMGFAKRQMQLFPPETHPFGPGEKSPMYPQWVLARSFSEGGQVKLAKIRKAFDDPQFYNTTMMFIEHEATLKMHALAVKKEFERSFKKGDIIRKNTVGRSSPSAETLLAAGLELDAVIMLFALVSSATGFVPMAMLSPVFVAGLHGAVGMLGGAAVWELGKDGIKRLIDGIRKNGDIRVFTKACADSLAEIKSQPTVMQHMKQVYGIDASQITFNRATGMPEFAQGTTSNSWEAIQKDLNEDIKLREMFLTDLVRVDRKRAHALTEQFLTEGPQKSILRPDRPNPFIVNQTGARYEQEVLSMFDQLRATGWPERNIGPNVPLDPGRQLELQTLYMEASRRVLKEKADAKFSAILVDIASDTMVVDGVEQKTNTVQNRKDNLKKGTKGADGKMEGEGFTRTALKAKALEAKEKAQSLIDGAPAKDGDPAKVGLSQMEKAISPTEAGGLFKRREAVQGVFTDVASSLRAQSFYTEAKAVADDNSLKAIDDATSAVSTKKNTLETTTLLPYIEQGSEEQAAKTAYDTTLVAISTDPAYTGKGRQAGEAAKQAAEQTYKNRMATIEQEREKIKNQIQKLEGLLDELKQKRKEIQDQYDAMSSMRPERVEIANTPQHMRDAYERVGTTTAAPPVILIPDGALRDYGQTGNQMSDYVLLPGFTANRPWAQTEDDKYENQKIILLAVAEAKAKDVYKANTGVDLHAAPIGAHLDMVGVPGSPGQLTVEQLITIPAGRVKEIMDTQTTTTYSTLSDVQKLQAIRDAQNLETQRYVARQKALAETMATQGSVVAQRNKDIEAVDQTCDQRIEEIALVQKFLEDRGNVYKEVRGMMTTESLNRYADGGSIANSTTMTPDQKEEYLLVERNSQMPRGFHDFLRDVFKYHELGRDVQEAGEIANLSPEKAYVTLIRALGGPQNAQRNVAHMIVDSFPPTTPPGEGFRRFITPPLPLPDIHHMTFSYVMKVLAYRNNPVPPPPAYGQVAAATMIPYADALTTQDMLSIVQNVADTIAKRTAATSP